MFVALRGERFDGHDFIPQAVAGGASALVVDDAARAAAPACRCCVVRDTTRALGALGRYRRTAWGGTVVGGGRFQRQDEHEGAASRPGSARASTVHATRGNLNNQVGVPLTLLAIPDHADVAVVEIGTNHPGEVAALRALVLPDVAVVTSIGEEHLEGLGDLAGVLAEECSVCEGASIAHHAGRTARGGDAARRLARAVVEAGLDRGDVRPDAWGLDDAARGWFTIGAERTTVPLSGSHNLRNALLAMAVTRACGIADAEAMRGIAALAPLAMRSTLETFGTLRVLNDAYNANPASAREALATFDALGDGKPRVVVLGLDAGTGRAVAGAAR